MVALALIAVVSVLAGAFAARWTALAVPVLLVSTFYAGLNLGWWGDGLGDGWLLPAILALAVIAAGTSVAIAIASGGRRGRLR